MRVVHVGERRALDRLEAEHAAVEPVRHVQLPTADEGDQCGVAQHLYAPVASASARSSDIRSGW